MKREFKPIEVTPFAGNHQLLYFTSTSLLAGDRGLVFLSDRTGGPNLFFLDFATKAERQLTHNSDGVLKSYVYFDGQPYRGLGKASVSLDPERKVAYYIQGSDLRAVDITTGRERTLAQLPRGQMTAFTHVSADGQRLCVPTTDARALDDETPGVPAYGIDDRVHVEGLSSYLRVFDTATGREIQTVPVPRAWITHVQFSPVDLSHILYNHEWTRSEWGVRRIWLWDGARHRQLRTESGPGVTPVRSRNDWTCHEMWERDGSALIYHGTYAKETPETGGRAFVGRLRADGSDPTEIALPAGWTQYGHFTVGWPGRLVTDGYHRTDKDDADVNGKWLALLDIDWQRGSIEWQPLLRHGSSWTSQDAHPHPILNERGDSVYYTSDIGGRRSIYRIDLD